MQASLFCSLLRQDRTNILCACCKGQQFSLSAIGKLQSFGWEAGKSIDFVQSLGALQIKKDKLAIRFQLRRAFGDNSYLKFIRIQTGNVTIPAHVQQD